MIAPLAIRGSPSPGGRAILCNRVNARPTKFLPARTPKDPLVDLAAQDEELRRAIQAAMETVCEGQPLAFGSQVLELEVRFAREVQCQYAIGVSSGNEALLLALLALDIGAGDEVITSAFAPPAAAAAIARAGARPIFCDIDPETYDLSAAEVDELIDTHCEVGSRGRLVNRKTGGRIKGLLPVHLFGQLCEMSELMELARHLRLGVIEDAQHAIGAHDASYVPAGSFADVGCFSFSPTNILSAHGDAGMCVTHNRQLAERIKNLRAHGAGPNYHPALVGANLRLEEMQAAVLNVKLDFLEDWLRLRDFNAHIYSELFASRFSRGGVVAAQPGPVGRHVFNHYVIRVQDRDGLHAHLHALDIETELCCPVPLHLQPCFAQLGYRIGDLPQTELAARETLSLPMYPQLTALQIEHIVAAIEHFYRG